MRIAMFTDYFYPELGGIQDSVAIVSRALAARGHLIDIHAPRYGRRDYHRIDARMEEPDLGPNVRIFRRVSVPFPSSTRQSRAAFPSPRAAAALAHGPRPDIIHTHSFFGVGLEALLAGAWHGIPVIGTNHTTVSGFGPHVPVSVDRASRYVIWYYNKCVRITAPSRSVFADLGPERLKPRQHVVSNPIDTDLFRPPADPTRLSGRAAFGLSGPVIASAGRLAPEKNLDVLLHAIARLRDQGQPATLALAGHGSHEGALKRLAGRLAITDLVRFLGTLRPDDLVRLFQASDLFAIPSTSETQSMVLAQAMATGLPVVAANSRALPEFVGPERGLLVDPHDPGAFAEAFATLLRADPAHRLRLGQAARAAAEALGVNHVTDWWEALYRSTLQERQAA